MIGSLRWKVAFMREEAEEMMAKDEELDLKVWQSHRGHPC